MTTNEIAERLIQLCRRGDSQQAIRELYGVMVNSIQVNLEGLYETKGYTAVLQKSMDYAAEVATVYDAYYSDPLIAGRYFSLSIRQDRIMKSGERIILNKVALYEVKDGKIIKEQFFCDDLPREDFATLTVENYAICA